MTAKQLSKLFCLLPVITLIIYSKYFFTRLNGPSEIYIILFKFSEALNLSIYYNHNLVIFGFVIILLWLATSLYSVYYLKKVYPNCSKETIIIYHVSLIFSVFCTLGVIFSGNLIVAIIFYEIISISTYFLVRITRTKEAIVGARFYLVNLLLCSVIFLLPALVWYYNLTGNIEFFPGNYISLTGHNLCLALVILFLFLFGTAKASIFPMCFWLPKAMVAPFPVSGLLHAVVVVKSGIILLYKIFFFLYGNQFFIHLWENYAMSYYGLVFILAATIFYGAYRAILAKEIKELLAYSTVSQCGLIMFVGTSVLHFANPLIGEELFFWFLINHSISKIILFLVFGYIYSKTRITHLSKLSHLYQQFSFSIFLILVALASMIGIPIIAGFKIKEELFFYLSKDLLLSITLFLSSIMTALYSAKIVVSFIRPFHLHS